MERDRQPRRVRRAEGRARGAIARDHSDSPVHDAVRPCLSGITYLAQRRPLPPNDVVFDQARALLARAKRGLDALSLDTADARDIYYALIAYIDEVLQAEPGPLEEFWHAHLLQLEHFGETRAGEGFFERLECARSEGRTIVVRVYYVCLLLGFRGIYAQHGELERENLIASVRDTLDAYDAGATTRALSPYGKRPDEPGVDRRRNRLLQSLAIASMSMAVCWYVGLLFVVDARADALVTLLRGATRDLTVDTGASRVGAGR